MSPTLTVAEAKSRYTPVETVEVAAQNAPAGMLFQALLLTLSQWRLLKHNDQKINQYQMFDTR